MAGSVGDGPGRRHGDSAGVEVADQPRARAGCSGHRAGPSTIRGALRSRDTDLMIDAIRTLGVTVDDEAGDGTDLTVSGRIAPAPDARVDCGLAGTVLRFVPPVAAVGSTSVTFDGDEQACSRPIALLLNALRGLGVDVDGDGLPFAVRGRGAVAGGTVEIDASGSSQFVSGLLLSGATFTDGLTIVHTGTSVPSAPHVAMTVAMLRDAGVQVDDSVPNRWRVSPDPSPREGGTSSRTCPTPHRFWRPRSSPAERCGSPAGRR